MSPDTRRDNVRMARMLNSPPPCNDFARAAQRQTSSGETQQRSGWPNGRMTPLPYQSGKTTVEGTTNALPGYVVDYNCPRDFLSTVCKAMPGSLGRYTGPAPMF